MTPNESQLYTQKNNKEILNSEFKYKVAAENMPYFFALFRLDGKLIYINKKLQTIIENEKKIKNVIDFLNLFSDKSRDKIKKAFRDISNGTEKTLKIEKKIKNKKTYYLMNIIPIKNKYGQITNILNIFKDISEEKKIEIIREEFITVAYHQIKEPLTAINLSTELLLAQIKDKLSDEQIGYFDDIKESIFDILNLINTLVKITKIELGIFKSNPEDFNIKLFTKNIVKNFFEAAKNKNISIRLRIGKELPETIMLDKAVIKTCLSNLISNAIKYTQNKGNVIIAVNKKNENIIFSVKDNGPGISEKTKPLIFTKLYYQVKNPYNNEKEGNGLGLYIVKKLTDKLGGKIWFKNNKGKGTCFFFQVPVK